MKRFLASTAFVSILALGGCTSAAIESAAVGGDLGASPTSSTSLAMTDEDSATQTAPQQETASASSEETPVAAVEAESAENAQTETVAAVSTEANAVAQSSDDTATQRIAAANAAPVAKQAATQSQETPASDPDARIAAASPVTANTSAQPNVFRSLFGRNRNESAETEKPVEAAALAAEPRQERRVIASTTARSSGSALPGVDRDRAFGINQNPSREEPAARVQLASAGGLARLAPNGLRTQHSGVDVKCLKPALVRMLKQIEQKYGKAPIITSGYRSPERNRRARGARNSLHMYCAAADIQVPGVSKHQLASYVRNLPGRGGVGTYCHTKSVHVDIGPRRDWNARCRRR